MSQPSLVSSRDCVSRVHGSLYWLKPNSRTGPGVDASTIDMTNMLFSTLSIVQPVITDPRTSQPGLVSRDCVCRVRGSLYWLKPNSRTDPRVEASIIDMMNMLLLNLSISFFRSVQNYWPSYEPIQPGKSRLCQSCPWLTLLAEAQLAYGSSRRGKYHRYDEHAVIDSRDSIFSFSPQLLALV